MTFSDVIVNGGLSSFFRPTTGLRQGDSLSPLLLIIVIEALNKILSRTRELQIFKGLKMGDAEHAVGMTHLFIFYNTYFSVNKMRGLY